MARHAEDRAGRGIGWQQGPPLHLGGHSAERAEGAFATVSAKSDFHNFVSRNAAVFRPRNRRKVKALRLFSRLAAAAAVARPKLCASAVAQSIRKAPAENATNLQQSGKWHLGMRRSPLVFWRVLC